MSVNHSPIHLCPYRSGLWRGKSLWPTTTSFSRRATPALPGPCGLPFCSASDFKVREEEWGWSSYQRMSKIFEHFSELWPHTEFPHTLGLLHVLFFHPRIALWVKGGLFGSLIFWKSLQRVNLITVLDPISSPIPPYVSSLALSHSKRTIYVFLISPSFILSYWYYSPAWPLGRESAWEKLPNKQINVHWGGVRSCNGRGTCQAGTCTCNEGE